VLEGGDALDGDTVLGGGMDSRDDNSSARQVRGQGRAEDMRVETLKLQLVSFGRTKSRYVKTNSASPLLSG
jgi:hypothetical protein